MTTTIATTSTPWKLYEKILFIFFASYFIAYLFPFETVFNLIGENAYENFARWVGKSILKINYKFNYEITGSGDTTFDYINQFCYNAIGLFIFVIWLVLDRKRKNYDKALNWISFFVRYYLGSMMLSYGFAKVFPGQFSFPGFNVLTETYGESSPMRLAWTFMGYSSGYTMFSGILEVIAGLLLLFRKTTTLGALITLLVMSNVVMINFCYDIPVKLFSSTLLLMSIFILAADGKRIILFILNKSIEPKIYMPFFQNKKLRITALVLQICFVSYLFYTHLTNGYESANSYGADAPKPPLFGLYNAEVFIKNGDTLAPLITDSLRWKNFSIPRAETAFIRTMNENSQKITCEVDTLKKTLTLYSQKDTINKYKLNYIKIDSVTLTVKGIYKNDTLNIKLKKVDTQFFLLVNRGFHWINEMPLNK